MPQVGSEFLAQHRTELQDWVKKDEKLKQEVKEGALSLMHDLGLSGEENYRRVAAAISYGALLGRAYTLAGD